MIDAPFCLWRRGTESGVSLPGAGVLREPEFASGPSGWQSKHRESDGVPLGTEVLVPGGDGSQSIGSSPHGACHEHMGHRLVGGEARCDVTGDDSVDRSVQGCEKQRAAGCRLSLWRNRAGLLEQGVCSDRENDADDNARENCTQASPDGG